MKKTLVADVMTATVVTAGQAIPYRQLVALLYARNIGAVPVTGPGGQVLGVVSNGDLITKAACMPAGGARPLLNRPWRGRERRKASARTAGELMTAPAITIAPAATIGEAAALMCRRGVGRLPVTYPLTGRLAGIVTRSDLLRVCLRPGDHIRAEIEAEVLPRVPGADPRRLDVRVTDGVVTISGRVDCWSAVARLVTAVLQAEGVVGVNEQLTYDVDDRYAVTPVFW